MSPHDSYKYTEVPPPSQGPVLQAVASWAASHLDIPVPMVRYFEPASPGDLVAFEAPGPILGRSSVQEPYTVWLWAGLPTLGSEYATRSTLREVCHQWHFTHDQHPSEDLRDRWEYEADTFADWGIEAIRQAAKSREERTL